MSDRPPHIGFTGTQRGLTAAQRERIGSLFSQSRDPSLVTFHHGDCIGADLEAATLAHAFGFTVHGHRCDIDAQRANFHGNAVTHLAKPPLDRNRDIVDASDLLIACPKVGGEYRRSGTWATVRYARTKGRTLPIWIITAAGSLLDGHGDNPDA